MVGIYYNDNTNVRIEIFLKYNIKFRTIVADEKRSLIQIYRKRRFLKFFGIINLFLLIIIGRPRSLTIEEEDGMENFLNEYFTAFFDEIRTFVAEEFDIEINRSIINRIFKRIKLT
jgi:transposase